MTTTPMPELPERLTVVLWPQRIRRNEERNCKDVFSAEQMQAYARAAIEASQRKPLTDIDELAKVYASSYASPHHITFTVEGLRNMIEAAHGITATSAKPVQAEVTDAEAESALWFLDGVNTLAFRYPMRRALEGFLSNRAATSAKPADQGEPVGEMLIENGRFNGFGLIGDRVLSDGEYKLFTTPQPAEGDAKDAPYDPRMMYAEKDKGVLEMRISGLSMREIKDIFELEYGAVVWSDGVAYPADKVVLKFTRADFSDIAAIASQKAIP